MTSVNRFIQFNNEQVNARRLMQFEQLARALANAPFLKVTERKLIELIPSEETISFSFFWKHRSEEVERAGQLTDIYLLSSGFWRHFNVVDWMIFSNKYKGHSLENLASQLTLLFEEFRLAEKVMKERTGTIKSFSIRTKTYLEHHKKQFRVNMQKGFLADALFSYLYIAVYEGALSVSSESVPKSFQMTLYPIENIYDAISTKDCITISERIVTLLEPSLDHDLIHTYYSVGDALKETNHNFHYHTGAKDSKPGDRSEKETVEEVFRTWHRENKLENGLHLNYELENGQSGKTIFNEASEGEEGAAIQQVGQGRSIGSEKESLKGEYSQERHRIEERKSGAKYGFEHIHVVYDEKRIVFTKDLEKAIQLEQWRYKLNPYVRTITKEFKKRIEQKQTSRRDHLSKGRLSSKLTTILTEERPQPFYRKTAPSKPLDAVFGLLVDGSASMTDKIIETKQAVLLFHDVLRSLEIAHEIASFYEDAYEASETYQPNVFEWMHKLEDGMVDSGQSILSYEAHEDNRDGFAIRWMAERLKNRPEKHKFILIFSDGEPSAFGYAQNGIVDTTEAVVETEKKGISVLHLFLNTVPPSEEQKDLFRMIYGAKTASSESVDDFSNQTLRIIRKMLSIVIRST